ncbi:MAG: hypothetical protein KAT81_06775, partial [Syntrophobacterales bacterium]|nr:hypothetical protein [Syntrophobacterales bacterium]
KCLKNWKIAVGRNPRHVLPNALIIFPSIPGMLFCGLSGILTIKRGSYVEEKDIAENISSIFEKIKKNNLKKLTAHKISREYYLGGDNLLRTVEGDVLRLKQDSFLEGIFFDGEKEIKLKNLYREMNAFLVKEEKLVEKDAGHFSTADMEHVNNALVLLRDCVWALDRDILFNIDKIIYLAGPKGRKGISKEGFRKYRNINFLLNSLDRLEVRGRDSAGIQITFVLKERDALDKALRDIRDRGLYDKWKKRLKPGDLVDGSLHISHKTGEKISATVSFTYKKASITGELGENGRYLRERIRSDQLFKIFINEAIESEIYLAHTRWASVGSITEENCHPINNFVQEADKEASSNESHEGKDYPAYGRGDWTINAAL